MPHKFYHGRTGRVWNITKRAIGVEVNKQVTQLAEKLKTNLEKGIPGSDEDILQRKNVYGTNTYPRKKGRSFWRFLWEACQDLILIILMVAAVASLALGITSENQIVEKYGPYGSQCATNWSVMLDECDSIREVIIRHANIVDGIGFVIIDGSGCNTTKTVGGQGGKTSKIVLRPNEYITQISGTHGEHKGSGYERRITSLRIHTNLCAGGYGPYGLAKNCQNVCSFSTPLALSDPIVGFFGRQGKFLDSIGIYMKKQCLEQYSPY